jgi:hypothetical protein
MLRTLGVAALLVACSQTSQILTTPALAAFPQIALEPVTVGELIAPLNIRSWFN